ncbi:MAG: DUF805 domain-containing protein [Pseudomonadota bacterium]
MTAMLTLLDDMTALRGRIGRGRLWLGITMIAVLLIVAELISSALITPNAAVGLQDDGTGAISLLGVAVGHAVTAALICSQLALIWLAGTVSSVAILVGGTDLLGPLLEEARTLLANTPVAMQPELPPADVLRSSALFSLAFNQLFALLALSIGVRRCHDRGRSGWWLLLTFIPLFGLVWWLIDLGLLAGERGVNRYGADPR